MLTLLALPQNNSCAYDLIVGLISTQVLPLPQTEGNHHSKWRYNMGGGAECVSPFRGQVLCWDHDIRTSLVVAKTVEWSSAKAGKPPGELGGHRASHSGP
eukprot:3599893-Amphidinium_carterae.1